MASPPGLTSASGSVVDDVLIVGGGIAGCAVALFLHRIGVSCRVFEAYPAPASVGGGVQLTPNGMHVLSVLGLEDSLAQRGAV